MAPVNKIIPLSVVDGPGARTAIFLQGCNIACLYCHNPETQRRCVRCGVCVPACPAGALSLQREKVAWDEAKCIGCDTCIRVCPHFASPKVKWMTAAQVMDLVLQNRTFLRGITVSGGECTLYPDFLAELFRRAKAAGLSTLIDSNGMVPFAPLAGLMDVTDGVMLDVKAWEPDVYRALTGAESNAVVKENLRWLAQAGKLEEVRVVFVPGLVDAEAAIRGTASLLGENTAKTRLKLIAFRCFGVRGQLAGAPAPDEAQMAALAEAARQSGFVDIVRV